VKTFFLVMIGSGIIAYGVMIVTAMVLGDAGFFVAGFLAFGAVIALLACTLEKLDRVEEKIDRLLKETDQTARED